MIELNAARMALLGQLLQTDITKAAMYVASLLLLFKLLYTGLFRIYPKFTVFIAFQILRQSILAGFSIRSTIYGYLFFAMLPILWVLYVLVLLELFQAALGERQGIATFGRKFVISAMGIGATIGVSTLFLNLQEQKPQYVILENFVLADRVVESALVIFLLLLTAFLAYFPVTLHRNAKIHAAVLSFYFLAKTAVLSFRSLFGVSVGVEANVAGRLITTACLLCWISLLTKAGEQRVVHSNWISGAENEEKLLAQLDAINATLLKTAKRGTIDSP